MSSGDPGDISPTQESPPPAPVMPAVDPEPEPEPEPKLQPVVIDEIVVEEAATPLAEEEKTILVVTTEEGEPIKAISRAHTLKEVIEEEAARSKAPTRTPTAKTISEDSSVPWFAEIVPSKVATPPQSKPVSRASTLAQKADSRRASAVRFEELEEEEPKPLTRTATALDLLEEIVNDAVSRTSTKRFSIVETPELKERIETIVEEKIQEMTRVHTAVTEAAAEIPPARRSSTAPPPSPAQPTSSISSDSSSPSQPPIVVHWPTSSVEVAMESPYAGRRTMLRLCCLSFLGRPA